MAEADSMDDGLFPISERRIEQGFYLLLLVWVGMLLVNTRSLGFSARLVPLIVAIPVLVLVLLSLAPIDWTVFLDRYVPSGPVKEDQPEEVEGLTDRNEADTGNSPAVEQRLAAELVGWIVALAVLIHAFGFYYTLPVYTFALTWYLKRDLKSAIVVTVLFVATVTLLFLVLFEQILFRGMVELPHPFV